MAEIFLGATEGGERQSLLLSRANRHGLIAGATGTGKTVTLQTMAEQFSAAGVPVFLADVKGDLSGICMPGSHDFKHAASLEARALQLGIVPYEYRDNPAVFWDLYGKKGHPIRTTISEMGPLLLSRLLGLNDTQEGVLSIAFKWADDNGLLLLDFEDLQQTLIACAERASELATKYGNISRASVGTIQRQLLAFQTQGADAFFGEPAFEINDFIRCDETGKGIINILAADQLMQSPKLYATFLLWLLSELFEALPEVGDPEKPNLVFFFDEAHLLFDGAPKALVDKIEQVVRLIRSKGVGVYFVTQNPRDLPENVLAQLGARVQHALRAYTPTERKGVKAAAQSFRPNPALDTETAITELGTGEALVSSLDVKGAPTVVERTLVRPPASRLGPATDAERAAVQALSPVALKYDAPIDRESAYEILTGREAQASKEKDALKRAEAAEAEAANARKEAAKAAAASRSQATTRASTTRATATRKSTRQTPAEAAGSTFIRTAAREATKFIFRGMFGNRKR